MWGHHPHRTIRSRFRALERKAPTRRPAASCGRRRPTHSTLAARTCGKRIPRNWDLSEKPSVLRGIVAPRQLSSLLREAELGYPSLSLYGSVNAVNWLVACCVHWLCPRDAWTNSP